MVSPLSSKSSSAFLPPGIHCPPRPSHPSHPSHSTEPTDEGEKGEKEEKEEKKEEKKDENEHGAVLVSDSPLMDVEGVNVGAAVEEAHPSMDIWAFGVTLYQLVTGFELFRADVCV